VSAKPAEALRSRVGKRAYGSRGCTGVHPVSRGILFSHGQRGLGQAAIWAVRRLRWAAMSCRHFFL
jgi:hypothetical protein